MSPVPITDLLAALRAVPGVDSAVIRSGDEDGGHRTLLVDLAPDFDDRTVVSDVGRLLGDRLGTGFDGAGSQVLQNGTVAGQTDDGRRPAIERVHLVASGLTVTANVTLSVASRTATGESTGTATQAGASRALATATLRVLESLVAGRARFEVDHVDTSTGSEPTVLVTVTMVSTEGGERLIGVAGVRGDLRQSVIRATLDAVNRRVDQLLA